MTNQRHLPEDSFYEADAQQCRQDSQVCHPWCPVIKNIHRSNIL